MIHPNGDIYYGYWIEGQAHGYGAFLIANGTKYVGYWSKDREKSLKASMVGDSLREEQE